MGNPWELEEDAVSTRESTGRVWFVSLVLWGLLLGSASAIVATETGDLTPTTAGLLTVLALVVAAIVLAVSYIVASAIQQYGVAAQMMLGILTILALFALAPTLVSLFAVHIPGFGDIPVRHEQPFRIIFEVLFGSVTGFKV